MFVKVITNDVAVDRVYSVKKKKRTKKKGCITKEICKEKKEISKSLYFVHEMFVKI